MGKVILVGVHRGVRQVTGELVGRCAPLVRDGAAVVPCFNDGRVGPVALSECQPRYARCRKTRLEGRSVLLAVSGRGA